MIGLANASGMNSSYGEGLLDAMHERHPEISSAQINAIGREGAPITLVRRWSARSKSGGQRALFDANGNGIGSLVLYSRCTRFNNGDVIGSELARRIYSAASLADPDPFVPGAVRALAGQAMIDDALERDPEIVTLAFHVTPPGGSTNSIVASSFGRIGKPADFDDQQVMKEGKTIREFTNNGKRVAIELPLLDFHGHIIGALSTSFRLEPGVHEDQIEKRAVALRDSLSSFTPSLKALFRSATVSRQVGTLGTCHS